MKFILISDSHGNAKGINKIFESQTFDYLFFLGDGLSDLGTYINLENVFAVSGNCDFFSKVVNEKYIEVEGKNIFMTHGNKYGVKANLTKLIERAEKLKVDFVFYGHTHKQKVEKIGDIYYINPGSFYQKSTGQSVGIEIIIEDNNVKYNILEIE